MTSLEDVYDGGVGGVTTRRRLLAGGALLMGGTLLAVLGLLVAVTELGGGGPDNYGARLIAGILFGLAAPAVLGGIVTVLPAQPYLRVVAGLGASLTILGVVSFGYAYPQDWAGYGADFTPVVSAVYALGILVLVYCVFGGIATLKQRNDPGGTVAMMFTQPTRIVTEQPDSTDQSSGFGGVGLLGADPDGTAQTQTGTTTTSRSPEDDTLSTAGHASDGGVNDQSIQSPGHDTADRTALTDQYCGNCQFVDYQNQSGGIVPYCQYHGRQLEDMEACDSWQSNRSS